MPKNNNNNANSILTNLRNLWERRNLVFTWTAYNIQSKYVNTRLGLVWIFLQPLITAAVYSLAFGELLKARPPRDGVPFLCFYFSGIVPWQMFTKNISASAKAIVSNLGTMTQIRYPREVSVLTTFLGNLVDFLAAFVVMIVIFLIYGIYPTINYLWLLVIIFVEVTLILGIMFFVSSLGVYIREIGQIVSPLLRLLFFMSGVIWSVENVKPPLSSFLQVNPMLTIIESFRNIVLHNELPDFRMLGIYFGVAVIILIAGYRYFKKRDATFVDHL